MTSSGPAVEARRTIIDAAERGAQIAGGDQRYVSLATGALKTVAVELAGHLQPGESASLCVPAEVAHDGRYDPGMVLLLARRVVIAWFEGTFRVKVRSISFAFSDISEVATATRDRGRLSPHRDAITFTAAGARHEFVLPSRVAQNRLTAMVSDLVSGAVIFGGDL